MFLAVAGVFIALVAMLFVATLSWFVSPTHPQPLSPRRAKGELTFGGWRLIEDLQARSFVEELWLYILC